jgi:hypothetical protein
MQGISFKVSIFVYFTRLQKINLVFAVIYIEITKLRDNALLMRQLLQFCTVCIPLCSVQLLPCRAVWKQKHIHSGVRAIHINWSFNLRWCYPYEKQSTQLLSCTAKCTFLISEPDGQLSVPRCGSFIPMEKILVKGIIKTGNWVGPRSGL